MAWCLRFYRRVGEPPLSPDEFRGYFRQRPRYHAPRSEHGVWSDSTETDVSFQYRNEEFGLTFEFAASPADAAGEEEARADFPFEESGVRFSMDYHQPVEAAGVAIAEVVAAGEALGLLVLDPQADQEVPGPADAEGLVRSYARCSREIGETIEYLHTHRRNLLVIAAAMLVAGLLLLLLLALSGGGPGGGVAPG